MAFGSQNRRYLGKVYESRGEYEKAKHEYEAAIAIVTSLGLVKDAGEPASLVKKVEGRMKAKPVSSASNAN